MSTDGYTISEDPTRLDLDVVHRYLSTESYWAQGLPRDVLERSVAGSLCFGIYLEKGMAGGGAGEQVGFARVITDRATFAWLADVFVLSAHRGRGLSKRLLETILAHPDLQGVRRFMLATADAHGLYRQFGWKEPARPQSLMERRRKDPYRAGHES